MTDTLNQLREINAAEPAPDLDTVDGVLDFLGFEGDRRDLSAVLDFLRPVADGDTKNRGIAEQAILRLAKGAFHA